jgi:hypothetical protein
MTWIDELETIFEEHLHLKHQDMQGLNDEVRMFIDFLVYSAFTEDTHTINCPFVGCDWHYKFNIKYEMDFPVQD